MNPSRMIDSQAANRLVDTAIESYAEWREECATVKAAYRSWSSAHAGEQAISFGTYSAALDREECAATAYDGAVERVKRFPWPDLEPRLLSPVSRSYSRAHVGGFLFGVVVAALLANTGKIGATAGEPVAAGAAP
jgi:hypothetical protein